MEQKDKRVAMELMIDYAALITAETIHNRELCKQAPYVALLNELLNKVSEDFKDAMRQLCRDGALECQRSVNGVLFEFTKPK